MKAVAAAALLLALWLALAACNAPPMYHSRAADFLKRKGVDAATIQRLVDRQALSAREIERLAGFDDVPTLHLLGSHPSAPAPLLAKLARHHNEEVRWGAASNPNTPSDLLFALRTTGSYSTMNQYLVRNPALPPAVLRDMIRAKEAQLLFVAMNPACPPDLMQEIIERGTDLERAWLAFNPGIPPEVMARLAQDPSPDVARMLKSNPAYRKWASRRDSSS